MKKDCAVSAPPHISDCNHLNKRLLSVKYIDTIALPFRLDERQAAVLRCLISVDNAPDETQRLEAKGKLVRARRSLAFSFESLPETLAGNSFAFLLFCSFGFFGNRPTRKDLDSLFARERSEDLQQGLEFLLNHGYIAREDQTFVVLKNNIVFVEGDGELTREAFLLAAFQDGISKVPIYLNRKRDAHFESGILSVKRACYRELLPRIRHLIVELQSQVEDQEADLLVRFNIQIYPVLEKPDFGSGQGNVT